MTVRIYDGTSLPRTCSGEGTNSNVDEMRLGASVSFLRGPWAIAIISTLTRTYSRVRQASITTEINEIVGGASALEEQ